MVFRDIRQFIEALDEKGELVRVKQEVDWDLEVGAISRRAYETEAPAILFENIKDYSQDYRIHSGSLGTYRRLAIAMGLDPDTPIRLISEEYERRDQQRIKPITVDSGPCKENIITGDEIDLHRFPAPMIHEGDGGRYIATWHLVVSRDPDEGWTNWGMYRFMVHDSKYLAGFPQPLTHLATVLRNKYIPNGKPMPVAIVIGAEPLTTLAASATPRVKDEEVEYAGALRQQPVELIKCESNDLLVPVHAEIVIEGEILPDSTAPEGPFGEYSGYRGGGIQLRPLCQVTAITHRTSPILTMSNMGILDECSTAWALSQSLAVKRRLKSHGIPVIDVFMHPWTTTFMVVVGVESGGRQIAEQIGQILTARRAAISKIVVVDRDVDVFHPGQVAHALATKCHPGRGIVIIEYEGKANPITPCYSAEERKKLKGATAVFDCTWPSEWSIEYDIPTKSCFTDIYPQKLQEKVLRNWTNYGFK